MSPEKTCADCRQVLPLDAFSSRSNGYCKPCNAARTRRWEANADPERVRAFKRAARRRWREKRKAQLERGEVPTPETKQCRLCGVTQPSSEYLRSIDTIDGLMRDCHSCRKARARAKNRRLRRAIFDRDGGRCHICGKKAKWEDFHLDHLFPVSKGGETTPSNLAVAHPICNIEKSDKVMPVQLRIGA